MKKTINAMLTTALLLALPALGLAAPGKPAVFVSIVPQKYFVDRISQNEADVSVMIEPGANPHVYEPKPRQMAALAGADLYLTIGVEFDGVWVPRLAGTTPGLTVVHTEEGVARVPMAEEHEHGTEAPHDGDHAEEHHHHDGLDPHIWLDPNLVRVQAAHIRDALINVDASHADRYNAGFAAFDRELSDLDRQIRDILSPVPAERRTFLVFHPSWGYFARAYGLHQLSLEVDGKEPSPRDLAAIIDEAREHHVSVIFVQPQFSEKSASMLARQIGARVVRLDPMAEDWSGNLLHAAHAFADAMQEQK